MIKYTQPENDCNYSLKYYSRTKKGRKIDDNLKKN